MGSTCSRDCYVDKRSWNLSHDSVPTSPISTNVRLLPLTSWRTRRPTDLVSARHQETESQTPRLRRHTCQGEEAGGKARQGPHEAAPRREGIRPCQNSLRGPERTTLFGTAAADRPSCALFGSFVRGVGQDPAEVLRRSVLENGASAAILGRGHERAIRAGPPGQSGRAGVGRDPRAEYCGHGLKSVDVSGRLGVVWRPGWTFRSIACILSPQNTRNSLYLAQL